MKHKVEIRLWAVVGFVFVMWVGIALVGAFGWPVVWLNIPPGAALGWFAAEWVSVWEADRRRERRVGAWDYVGASFLAEAERLEAETRGTFVGPVDTEELADVLVRDLTYSTGLEPVMNDAIARQQARAAIDWLTKGEKLSGPERQIGVDPRV